MSIWKDIERRTKRLRNKIERETGLKPSRVFEADYSQDAGLEYEGFHVVYPLLGPAFLVEHIREGERLLFKYHDDITQKQIVQWIKENAL